ncbi:MAG: hypothetical protein ABI645_11720 [Pseudomonadota bacterium]
MNCQDIARIVDTGSIRNRSQTEYGAAELHARSCRDCAAIWGVQSRLVNVNVPATPPLVATRFQRLASLPDQSARGYSRRRLVVIGSLVALAAAAGVWMWVRADSQAPQRATRVVAVAPKAAATPQIIRQTAMPPALQSTAPAVEPEEAGALSFAQLPLVPAPAGSGPPDLDKSLLTLQKAVERHPELKQGPELDDASTFIVSLAMRADGSVLDSTVEMASPATFSEIRGRFQRSLPSGGGESAHFGVGKGAPLPGGGTLRANVSIFALTIRDGFDLAHSDVRVREILGHQYDDLGLPDTSNEVNVLTVFLSEEGRILREKVDLVDNQNASTIMGASGGARRAEPIARTLGIDAEKIGTIGMTSLEKGGLVRYAWERQSGQSAPARVPEPAPADAPDFDFAAALTVVKHLFPDAFSHAEPAPADYELPMPTVVFTAKGKVISSGRLQMSYGVSMDKQLQEQLVPGIRTGLDRIVRLTDKTGATALVHFAWESPR